MTLLLNPRNSVNFHGLVMFSSSNMEIPGRSRSANLALAVINKSEQTINSHLDVSFSSLAVRLMSPC